MDDISTKATPVNAVFWLCIAAPAGSNVCLSLGIRVSGHDFSRAVKGVKENWALAPASSVFEWELVHCVPVPWMLYSHHELAAKEFRTPGFEHPSAPVAFC